MQRYANRIFEPDHMLCHLFVVAVSRSVRLSAIARLLFYSPNAMKC